MTEQANFSMQKITISHPSDAWQRIDRFCKKYLPNAALGGIYKMLRTGKIKVNGKKKDQTYKIEEGDEITLWMSDEEISAMQSNNEQWTMNNSEIKNATKHWKLNVTLSPLSILYEDEYLMVLDKPAWLNVHSWDHKTTESNLIDQVQDYLKGKYDSLTFRPALVHRIDRDTSGCILIAKTKPTLEALLADLQDHRIEKVYHAIVCGVPAKPADTIRARLLRIEDARDEAKVRVDEAGQSALTHYKVVKSEEWRVKRLETDSTTPIYSLLECRIETGRTHQIRVHLAYIGCPILGDKAYGDKKINSYMSRHQGITRQMLHARVLSFTHPVTKKRLSVEAPYPEDFAKLMSI
jgi:23S rRNA pseudouridine1911/1915/1917 synthase